MTTVVEPQTVARGDVVVVPVSKDMTIYMLGDMSFDEEDRDLAYIDSMVETWLAWREWVVKNGERE